MLKAKDNPPIVHPEGSVIEQMPRKWCVAHTKARNEKALAWELLKKDIAYFLPMVEKTTVSRGRRSRSLVVLFSGYVFLCGSREDRYAAMTTNRIASTIEVIDQGRLVKELGSIQKALEAPKKLDPFPYLRTGKKCLVTSGPLKGVEGILVRRKNISRLVLQVQVLGQAVATEIDASLLEPID